MGDEAKCYISKSEVLNFYSIIFTFNSDMVEELKESIPREFRKWDPLNRRWLFSPLYLNEVLAICGNYFEGDQITVEIDNGISSSDLFLQLFDLLKAEDRERVYRALSMALHPDRGGSTELMKLLNNAHDHYSKIETARDCRSKSEKNE